MTLQQRVIRGLVAGGAGFVGGILFVVVLNGLQGIENDLLLIALVAFVLGTLMGIGGLLGSNRAIVAAAVGLLGGMLLVALLRSMQHIEPVVDWGPMVIIGIPLGLLAFLGGLGIVEPGLLSAGKPGISRAVVMAIEGFMFGALLVIIVRGLQSLDPIWDGGVGIVFMAIFAAAFFVWGVGAFDPSMSVHGEEHAEEEHAEAEEAGTPGTLLGTDLWRVAFFTVVVLVVLFGVATIPNFFTLQTVGAPEGNAAAVGYVQMPLPFGGPEITVSYLVLLGAFIIFTFLSLAAAAGAIGLAMYFLSRGVAETKGEPSAEDRTPPYPLQLVGRIVGGIAGWLRNSLPRQLGQR